MKLSRTKRRRSRSTVSESDIMFLGALLVLTLLKCVAFNGVMQCVPALTNVYQFRQAFLVHTFSFNIIHLGQCVPCVPCVPAFLSCIYGFFKNVFFFLKRTSTQIQVVHMVHTAQSRMFTHFFTFQSWYTCWYTVGTHRPLAGTHVPQSMFHSLLCPLTISYVH